MFATLSTPLSHRFLFVFYTVPHYSQKVNPQFEIFPISSCSTAGSIQDGILQMAQANCVSTSLLFTRRQHFFKQQVSAVQVQSAADCDMNFILSGFSNLFDIFQTADTSGVGDRNPVPSSQQPDQLLLDSAAFPLHIHSVNQKFIAERRQHRQNFFRKRDPRISLPAIRHDIILPVFLAAAQIQNQTLFADSIHRMSQ